MPRLADGIACIGAATAHQPTMHPCSHVSTCPTPQAVQGHACMQGCTACGGAHAASETGSDSI